MNQKSSINLLAICLMAMMAGRFAQAHPYASGVINDGGTIRFILNEGGGDVTVTFEDASTYPMGVCPKGETNFPLGSHTSFSISVYKAGNGVPSLISSDAVSNNIWANPRGVAVNKNPKDGRLFGRIYAGSGGTGGFAFGTPGYKPQGVFAYNADNTQIAGMGVGTGTNAAFTAFYANGGLLNGPWRMRVAPDNSLLVCDFSTANASLMMCTPDLTSIAPVLYYTGQLAAASAGIHGDFFGTPLITGSLAEGNLVLWTADSGMAVPPGTTTGPGTSVGSYNCVFRYDIGSGPLPWNSPPNYAYTMGLDGIPELRTEMTLGKDGKVICGFGRANLSNPNIQILSPDGSTLLYSSGITPPANIGPTADPWRGEANGTTGGTYAGVRVSEDGRFLASVDINNGVTIATLTNGIPDDGSIFGIANTPTTGNSRGMDWDAANNVYVTSSGQGLLRVYSLGLTTTCVTSNDWTGTNGSFNLTLPGLSASIVTTTPNASQNYINNDPPGTPIDGVFTVSLDTPTLSESVTVNFNRPNVPVTAASSPAQLTNHYNFNYGPDANGVVVGPNSITFPAGTMPGGGNWSTQLRVTPTATPLSTNTLVATVALLGGSNYLAGSPARGTVLIQNTGPQLLFLTAAASGTTMYRGVTNDYAKFVITRFGDTNGPNNSPGNVNPLAYTVTNVSYFGTAVYPTDYRARAQRLDPAGNGAVVPPVDGPTAIVLNPSDAAITCVIGNPVRHADLSLRPTNLTVVLTLTNNLVSGSGTTNLVSNENLPYTVGLATVALTEIDNTTGPETVLWSSPLTNANENTWTLTFAGTNFGPGNRPVVLPNYTNGQTATETGGTNDFLVHFGEDISLDGIDPSPVMVASNWNRALKMTVNKGAFAHAGVNVFPPATFQGNYALRFNMYLSLYGFAKDNPNIGSAGREFAIFGVNHYGTNCNWRADAPINTAGAMGPTNVDGVWFAVDAGAGSTTPADFESYVPGPVPNSAASAAQLPGKVSASAASQNGVFKHPPFDAMNVTSPTVTAPGGGEAVNKWVDVSVEIKRQTNAALIINGTQILNFSITNGASLATAYLSGKPMLGYLDPNQNVSDNSAFVYYSNVRVVEVSPYISLEALALPNLVSNALVAQFSSLTFTSAATFATAPITNVWYRGAGNSTNKTVAISPTVALQTNSINATSMEDTFTKTFNSAVDGTNYMCVFSDAAGSVTSSVVAVTVILGPTNRTYSAGSSNLVVIREAMPLQTRNVGAAGVRVQWYFNTVSNLGTATKLVNTANSYGGVTSTNLIITNVLASHAGYYWAAYTNHAGYVIPEAAFLTVVLPPADAIVAPTPQTNLWGSNTTFTVTVGSGTPPFTYQWKKNGNNLAGATTSVLNLPAITAGDAGTYTAGVTNAAGGILSSSGLLVEVTPSPTIGMMAIATGSLTLPFTSSNPYDTSSSFYLETSGVVTGPYVLDPSAIFSGTYPNFQVAVSVGNETNTFLRLRHKD